MAQHLEGFANKPDEFRVHQFRLGGRSYILLPKLNRAQIEIFKDRLSRKGYSVDWGPPLKATAVGSAIHIAPAGYCWSAADPSDAILPVIPEILSTPREMIPLPELTRHYLGFEMTADYHTVRLSTRIESSRTWRLLREEGLCALTPDEHAAALLVLGSSSGCKLLTDFPVEESKPRRIGRRQYFEAQLDAPGVISTLNRVGWSRFRNSYLPREGIIRFDRLKLPSREALAELFGAMGDWCYFQSESRESSNS